jgi:uncharacterized protein YkwD
VENGFKLKPLGEMASDLHPIKLELHLFPLSAMRMPRNALSRRLLHGLKVIVWLAVLASHASTLSGQELKEFDRGYLKSPAHGPALRRAEQEIIRRTNDFRYRHKLADLHTNDSLQKSADYFAAYLARTDKFGHEADGNNPEDRASLSGYESCIVAENIAWQMRSTGFTTSELSRSFVETWQNSPPHRENMLDPDVTETGVAIGYSPRTNRYYAVQEFGSPKSAALRFEVTNLTPDTLHYTIEPSQRDTSPPQPFDLPPRATMTHTRCRPTTIDWAWTEKDDALPAKNGQVYVITKTDHGYEVAEKNISNRSEPVTTNPR